MPSAYLRAAGLPAARRALASARVVISDVDGVLIDKAGLPVRGAAELFRSRPCALVSNNSTLTARTMARRFTEGGAPISPERIRLAGERAVEYAAERFLSRPVFWLASDEIDALAQSRLVRARSVEETACVLVCRDRTLSMERIEWAVNALRRGAAVILANPDLTHPAGDHVRMETGAVWEAVRVQLGRCSDPVLIGKPETALCRDALRALGADRSEAVFLGDNPATDGLAAERLGIDFIHTGGAEGFPLHELVAGLEAGAEAATPS